MDDNKIEEIMTWLSKALNNPTGLESTDIALIVLLIDDFCKKLKPLYDKYNPPKSQFFIKLGKDEDNV